MAMYHFTRRRFLAAGACGAAAATLPCCMDGTAWGKPDLKPVPKSQLDQIMEAIPKKASVEPKKKRKLLIMYKCNGFVHRSIAAGNESLVQMGKATGAYDAVVTKDEGMFTGDTLKEFDGILFNNTTRLSFEKDSQRADIMDFIAAGKGMMGIHAATDNFYAWPEAAQMMGGLFAGHPWGAGGTWSVKLDDPDHPVNAAFGGKGFWIKDEIYNMKDPYSRDIQRVLLSLDMTKPPTNQKRGRQDNDLGIAWVKETGGGRVFYCSMGHNEHIYWTAPVLKHYLDGIQFALGDLQADATPSAKLAEQPQPALAPAKP